MARPTVTRHQPRALRTTTPDSNPELELHRIQKRIADIRKNTLETKRSAALYRQLANMFHNGLKSNGGNIQNAGTVGPATSQDEGHTMIIDSEVTQSSEMELDQETAFSLPEELVEALGALDLNYNFDIEMGEAPEEDSKVPKSSDLRFLESKMSTLSV